MPRPQFNARLSELTHEQIDELAEKYNLNKTEVVTLAIDRLWMELNPREESTIEKSDSAEGTNA